VVSTNHQSLTTEHRSTLSSAFVSWRLNALTSCAMVDGVPQGAGAVSPCDRLNILWSGTVVGRR